MKRPLQALFLVSGIFFSSYVALKNTAPAASEPAEDWVAASSIAEDAPAPPISASETDADPMIAANAVFAALYGENRVLYESNAGNYWPLASLTKIMTAIVALENLPATPERDALIRRMMIISDNAAADTLADTLGMDAWIEIMNAKAAKLGMAHTGFWDASGLSYLNQSTAEDVYRLASYALAKHPELFAWSLVPAIEIGEMIQPNINEFVGRDGYMGGKTGFTDEAHANLLTIWQTTRGPLIMILFGARDKSERFAQTEKLHLWLSQRFRLYAY